MKIRARSIVNGLYLGHPYNITVETEAIMGDYCNLHKECTILEESKGSRKGSRCLLKRMYVGINSVIIDGIKIGDGVMIAPNWYETFDVLSLSVVISNSATVHYK